MSFIEDHVRYIEESKLPFLRGRLADLESGRMKIVGEGVDLTPEDIRRCKEDIAEYEDIVAKLRAGEAP
jgi:hypothetical protein